jgi:hypothetical protein
LAAVAAAAAAACCRLLLPLLPPLTMLFLRMCDHVVAACSKNNLHTQSTFAG